MTAICRFSKIAKVLNHSTLFHPNPEPFPTILVTLSLYSDTGRLNEGSLIVAITNSTLYLYF